MSVRTFGKDKLRISAVLSILANGLKLPPLLVFRGKTGGPKENKLQKNIHCINGEIYVKHQDNAWTDINIFSTGLITFGLHLIIIETLIIHYLY